MEKFIAKIMGLGINIDDFFWATRYLKTLGEEAVKLKIDPRAIRMALVCMYELDNYFAKQRQTLEMLKKIDSLGKAIAKSTIIWANILSKPEE